MNTFGDRLKKSRQDKKLTQIDVAKKLGIDDTTISKYENNKSEPDNDTLKKLSSLYDVSVDWLMGKPKDSVDKMIDYLELNLTDEEIMERMTIRIDDMILSEDEAKEFIAFVRYQRAMKKQVPASKIDGP